MIKTLRKKFIFFAMAAVTALLMVLLLSINGLAWFTFDRQSDEMLAMLVNSEGNFMRGEPIGDNPFLKPPDRDIIRSARYFIVQMNNLGTVILANVDEIFFVSTDEAIDFAKEAIDKGTDSGRIDRYKYVIKQTDDGAKVYFLDITRERLTMMTLLRVSALIAAASWLFVFLFVVLLSKRFVHPIIAGFEKQKQFITNAGHELKTPLAIIQSNNDAMSLIHGENKYNRNIKSQVNRLSDLTANLLMQAKLDEEVELKKEQLDLSALAESVIIPYQDTARNNGLIFSSDITPSLTFTTNKEAFIQLLTILMDNAMKYTTDNGDIEFTLSEKSGHIHITEENSCSPDMNIDPDLLFERFFRGDSARTQTDQHSGYGIGLSVARSICEALGGELKADYPTQGRIRFTAVI